ncbi:hypothetical protein STCU_04471 [Strigomonas culicis]|nr:hypothetical protein STCU_04471 [Strigomonas culicis]|eukprot:EPY29550.1 hypothetical protein STCU_04471 [Strigomonas culicis]
MEDRCDILRTSLQKTAVNISRIAALTDGFSGADLKAFCAGVLLELLRDGDASLVLQDKEQITLLFENKLKAFNCTTYDLSALTNFENEHHLA